MLVLISTLENSTSTSGDMLLPYDDTATVTHSTVDLLMPYDDNDINPSATRTLPIEDLQPTGSWNKLTVAPPDRISPTVTSSAAIMVLPLPGASPPPNRDHTDTGMSLSIKQTSGISTVPGSFQTTRTPDVATTTCTADSGDLDPDPCAGSGEGLLTDLSEYTSGTVTTSAAQQPTHSLRSTLTTILQATTPPHQAGF